MLDGEVSKCVDKLQGVAQICTLSRNLFKMYMNEVYIDLILAAK